MEVCNKKHDEIVYEGSSCPLCIIYSDRDRLAGMLLSVLETGRHGETITKLLKSCILNYKETQRLMEVVNTANEKSPS